ncbi:uncharacterized protein LOC126893892 [Daktulosphaira vitifoliae]|uniref:uncharacterized protein LOC126893892 n=1 Tax=Daktulosphaira vitifoliae TaxID=58002 RepID=UPI0021A992DE|nr:uncharacterized protein LOC126893892 [Daktulosphaira vitifoliae]
MLDQENQHNLPNGIEPNRSFQDKTVIKDNQNESLDISLADFNVSQLANKLESLALATPQTIKTKPANTVFEKEFDLKDRSDSTDSESGRPLISNNSSIYRSFIADSVENLELELSSTLCHDELNKNCSNIESFHETLSSVNLDLVSSEFDDSQNLLHQSTLDNTINISDYKNLETKNNSSMDGLEAEIKLQQLNISETNIKNSSEAGPVIAEGFTPAVGIIFFDTQK